MRIVFEIENIDQLDDIKEWLADKKIVIDAGASHDEVNSDIVSIKERQRRTAILRKFKGKLSTLFGKYETLQNEWYSQ